MVLVKFLLAKLGELTNKVAIIFFQLSTGMFKYIGVTRGRINYQFAMALILLVLNLIARLLELLGLKFFIGRRLSTTACILVCCYYFIYLVINKIYGKESQDA